MKLLPLCDDYQKVHALCANCRDGTKAPFSFRVTSENEQISIGSDNYKPLCRKCYCIESQKQQQQKQYFD